MLFLYLLVWYQSKFGPVVQEEMPFKGTLTCLQKYLVFDLQLGMFKNNEAFHFMASYAHVCLDFKDQT